MEQILSFKNRREYRNWLKANCLSQNPIWIEFYKDGREGITYREALEESLSFGWIDSLIKKVDEKVYVRKFSRRSRNSKWSTLNKTIVEKLIKSKLMTKYGIQTIDNAKKNGQWDKEDERIKKINIDELREILKQRINEIESYDKLSNSLKKHYSLVYFSARKEETRKKRLEIIIEYMKNKKRFM